ncbi:MAG: helix-turn-helix domain-containing protein [Conexibacter sp.]
MSEPLPTVCDVALAISERELEERAAATLRAAGHRVRPLAATAAADELRAGELLLLGATADLPDPTAELRVLAEAAPAAAVVALLGASAGKAAVRRALRAGALGVVLAPDVERTLPATVQAVAAGQLVMPAPTERQLARPALSVRERQVLSLVVMGLMNGEIAQQLFVAESTVKSHLSSAFSKLGVRSRTEAVELILDPDDDAGLGILRIGGEPLATVAEAS